MEIKGIDVSAWQGKIDWKTVADYGMGFAILRITEAGNVVDSQFENNLAGCNKYNIPVGVYKYSYAMTIAEIQREARKVVSTLNGRRIQFPVFLDLGIQQSEIPWIREHPQDGRCLPRDCGGGGI